MTIIFFSMIHGLAASCTCLLTLTLLPRISVQGLQVFVRTSIWQFERIVSGGGEC